jgi:sterol desaturase/sphingolipid hydroxylase (fatty acid hydroxylase superfamily)
MASAPMAAGRMTRLTDHAIPPAFLGCAIAATYALLALRVPDFLVTGSVLGAIAVAAAIVERVRPERSDYRELDQPLAVEAAHFVLNYQLGYALALGGCAATAYAMKRYLREPLWPAAWPLVLQIAFAALVAEGVSYWQHRLMHRIPSLWRFHALHHSGARLNLLRAGRFHFVDVGSAAFTTFVPLVLLGAPDAIVTWVASITGALGVILHANMRMRTPAWLDRVICTPAVHRHHHSRVMQESNRNFGTVVMVFDALFGSYQQPRSEGPPEVGIDDDPVPRGFWNQVVSPFRATRASSDG